jgi:ADP-dependent NAD(P)H-hydrate dehydratase / NAD(P)H-hydrate epimerase
MMTVVQKVITAAQMREIDRLTAERYGLPSLLLMESAARSAFNEISARFAHDLTNRCALVLCGAGNNGGDGAVLARMLYLSGARVYVALFGRVEETKGDARTNFEIICSLANEERPFSKISEDAFGVQKLAHSSLFFSECLTVESWDDFLFDEYDGDADVLVDALFGTGLTRPLTGIHEESVRYIQRMREVRDANARSLPLIISLDLPSGLNADSPEIIGETVCADLTVTFTAPKVANVLPPAAHYNGELNIAPIGSPPTLIAKSESQLFVTEEVDARMWLEATRVAPDSYKNLRGHALIIAGSREFAGAAILASEASVCAGAGLVTLATPVSAHPAISARVMPEVMVKAVPETSAGAVGMEAVKQVMKLAERATVVAIGSGLTSSDEETRLFVRHIVEGRTTPIVIDADGLNSLAPWPDDLQGTPEHPLILTPHVGEMRRLIGMRGGEEIFDRVKISREFACAHHVIVVLKGARTIIAAPNGRVFVNPTGNAGLGTAGTGDTLTGIIASFVAQSRPTLKTETDALRATLAAVFIGGRAGDIAARERGMRTMIASDVRENLSAAIRSIDARGEMP